MALIYRNWNMICLVIVLVSAPWWPGVPTLFWLIPCALMLVLLPFLPVAKPLVVWLGFKGLLLGLIVVILQINYFQAQVHRLFASGEHLIIKGQVDSFFTQFNHAIRFTFDIDTINGQSLPFYYRPRVNILLPDSAQFHLKPQLSERWQLAVKLKPVVGRLNQAGFDLESYYLAKQWHGRAVVVSSGDNQQLQVNHSWRLHWYQQAQLSLVQAPYSAFIFALSFGDKSHLSAQHWQQLKNTGLIHLMAISGLHIGIAFALGWWLGHGIRVAIEYWRLCPWLPVCSALCFAYGYAYLAGFSIPTQRALLMCLVVSVTWLSGRYCNAWQSWLYALLTVLLWQPFSALSSGFCFSFAAVAAILISLQWWQTRMSARPKWQAYVVIQFGLLLGLMSLSVYSFFGFSWLAPLINILAISWVSVVTVPLIFLSIAVASFELSAADVVWQWAHDSLLPLIWLLRTGEVGWIDLPHGYSYWLALLTLCVVVWGWLTSFARRWLVLVIILLAGQLLPSRLDSKVWFIHVLDVGQGLAILVEKNGHFVLYDTGSAWPGGGMAQAVIAPVMNYHAGKQLDGLVLSHMDNDHAGGKAFIEQNFNPQWLRSSQKLTGYQDCSVGQSWHWQGIDWQALWPPKPVERAYNPHSCVIKISADGFSLLLSGDINTTAEWLLSRQNFYGAVELASDVLIVPHHGSLSSSSEAFIAKVQPQVAIASLSLNNQWQLPHPEVVQRYRQQNVTWLDTAHSGQIIITVSPQGWNIDSMRSKQYQPWYRQILRKGLE